MADNDPELMQLPSVDDIHESHRIFDSGVGGSTRRKSPEGRRSEIIFTACSSLDPHTIFHFTGGVWFCGHSHGRVIRPMSGMPKALLPWPFSEVAKHRQIAKSCRQLGLIPLWSKHESVDGYAPVPCDEQTLETGAQVLEEVHKVLQTAGGTGPQSSPSADTDRETGRFDLDAFMRKSHEFAQKHQGNYLEYTGIQLQRTQIGDFTVWQPAGQPSADGQERSHGGGSVSSSCGGSWPHTDTVRKHLPEWCLSACGTLHRDGAVSLPESAVATHGHGPVAPSEKGQEESGTLGSDDKKESLDGCPVDRTGRGDVYTQDLELAKQGPVPWSPI